MGRTIISRSDEQATEWAAAAKREGAPSLSDWIRVTLDEAAGTPRILPSEIMAQAIEDAGMAVAADLTEEMHADGSLPHGCEIKFETHPLIHASPLPDRGVALPRPERPAAWKGPDPKPTAKPKKERRR